MKINWNPSEKTKLEAKKIFELKSNGYTFPQIQKLFPYHRTYLFALRNLGKQLFDNPKEVDPSYPPMEERI